MPKTSIRGQQMPSSPIRKLAPLAEKAKVRGVKVFHLNIGQPDLNTPTVAIDALKNIDRKLLEYSPSQGFKNLREKMVEYYNRFDIHVSADDIIITTGGSEAVNFAFMSCLDQGDEIIVPEPAYANYTAFALGAGVNVRPLISTIENGFALPPIAEFEKLITPKTKGILICNPNNPTGYLYSKEELLQLCELVKKYDLFLFSDEVYREFCYTGTPYTSALSLKGIEENVILIDSFSKRYSECGIRIGALVCRNKQVRENVMKYCQARLSPPLLGQIVAEASLNTTEEYMNTVYNEYLERRNLFIEGLNKINGVYSPMPMGSFYTLARLPIDNCENFCRWLLNDFEYEKQTVMLAPASGFYTSQALGHDEARIAYVLEKAELKKALFVLEKALEAYPHRTTK